MWLPLTSGPWRAPRGATQEALAMRHQAGASFMSPARWDCVEPLAAAECAFYRRAMDPAERSHTVTIVSDMGGSVVSIPFLTAEEAARITDRDGGEHDAEEG